MLGVEFDLLGAVFDEVWCEGDFVRFEEEDGGGTAEGEVAFFVAFFHGLAGSEGLLDGADTGGADFHADDGAHGFGLKLGDGALVFPHVGEALTQGEGGDGKEGAVDDAGFAGGAIAGKVEAVVVDGAEAAEDEGAVLILFCEFGIVEEAGDVEFLTFDEDGADLTGLLKAEMAAIGWEHKGGISDGAGTGF